MAAVGPGPRGPSPAQAVYDEAARFAGTGPSADTSLMVTAGEIPDDLARSVSVKLRVSLDGAHVRVQVFVGPNGGTRALTGILRMLPPEWLALRALTVAGALLSPADGVTLVIEGEEDLHRALGWAAP